MEIANILGLFNNKGISYLFIIVGNFQSIVMGEILFAIINLIIGVFALCCLRSDKDK